MALIYRFIKGVALLGVWSLYAVGCYAQASNSSSAWGEPFPAEDEWMAQAQAAWLKRDSGLLARYKQEALQLAHPLAAWVDYWDMNLRMVSLKPIDVEDFYKRWPGSYVEDRFRNDWLIELGRRRDWASIQKEYPRFLMNDDRQVTCYWHLALYHADQSVALDARKAWMEQLEGDEACHLMAKTLLQAGVFKESDVWQKLLNAMEATRLKSVNQAMQLLPDDQTHFLRTALEKPASALEKKNKLAGFKKDVQLHMWGLLLARYAQQDLEAAARWMDRHANHFLPPEWQAWVWAQIGRQAALRVLPEAAEYYQKAWDSLKGGGYSQLPWSNETLAWSVRAALRSNQPSNAQWILKSIEQMSEREQQEPVWRYWRARALQQSARSGDVGEGQRNEAKKILEAIANPLHFYGKLALEDLGRAIRLPPKPAEITLMERAGTRAHPGLQRALRLIALDLRSEGVREWNFSLRGMNDRQLLAAAQWACYHQVWDRCINTSDRTRQEVDISQRYPIPYRADVMAHAKDAGLDPAYVLGLIRQESRFISDARSHVGAGGLMQVMPTTAKWVAKKIGMPFQASMLKDRVTNLRLGTHYLKWVLDDLGGSQLMAAAAYNAGPGRPRRWREGATIETAAWAESIPFTETRDYVKKVLSNAVIYSAQLGGESVSLKGRLGAVVGPRGSKDPGVDMSLP